MKRKHEDILTPQLEAEHASMLSYIDEVCAQQLLERAAMVEAGERVLGEAGTPCEATVGAGDVSEKRYDFEVLGTGKRESEL